MSSPQQPTDDRGPLLAAAVFDMDGVVTNTARIHAAAWKALFDEVLRTTAPKQALFDVEEDYRDMLMAGPGRQGFSPSSPLAGSMFPREPQPIRLVPSRFMV